MRECVRRARRSLSPPRCENIWSIKRSHFVIYRRTITPISLGVKLAGAHLYCYLGPIKILVHAPNTPRSRINHSHFIKAQTFPLLHMLYVRFHALVSMATTASNLIRESGSNGGSKFAGWIFVTLRQQENTEISICTQPKLLYPFHRWGAV